ncbi:hypothetical protein LJC21_00275 [Bacteroides sp. OttesenSCG-928-E20]|nr:hypothetical protein [Bacteroides sp. OttesenSCG-928-E20]MDL2306053.1 hypothetical protein [Bacteroides sp. OttesenSCG-928-D19]
MELNELKEYWKEEDKRISANIKVNKEASMHKLRSSLDRIRIRRLINLVLSCLFVPTVFSISLFPNMKNDGTILFYVALASFIVPILFAICYSIYYTICLLKIDFSVSVLKSQQTIARLQRFDKKLNVMGLIVAPIVFLSTFKIFNLPFNEQMIALLLLMLAMLITGFVVRLKVLIPGEYRQVKANLKELEEASGL